MSGGMLTDAADQKLNACTPVPGACPLPFWLLWNVRVMQHKVGHGVLSVSPSPPKLDASPTNENPYAGDPFRKWGGSVSAVAVL